MKIAAVRALIVDVPISQPIVMGEIRYDSRDYLLVEITTDDGIRGIGFGMARYAPVATIVDRNLTPLLLGQDPLATDWLWERMYYSNLIIGGQGIFMRALSAVDMALWDIKGKALGAPVWQLLGGYRTTVAAQVAGCYPGTGVTLSAMADEIRHYVEDGYGAVKIAAGQLANDTARLRVAREVAPDTRLIYDVHWGWRDVMEVLPVVRVWEAFNLDSIEDPFPSMLGELAARFKAHVHIPLALGEDLVGRWAFRDLFRGGLTDLVRIDATTMGGISEAARVCAMASAEGLPVSPHVFPEVHIHLAAAFANVRSVEVTDRAYELDVLYRLFRTDLVPERGELAVPTAPGLGVEVDWDAVDGLRRA